MSDVVMEARARARGEALAMRVTATAERLARRKVASRELQRVHAERLATARLASGLTAVLQPSDSLTRVR